MMLARSSDRPAQRQVLEPSRPAKLAAMVHSGSLDRALAGGADPAASRALAARTAILSSRRTRKELAEGLERLARAGHEPMRRWWALDPREALRANGSELLALAQLLRGSQPLYVRGLAILYLLLSDGTGPAYEGDEAALTETLGEAHAALRGASPIALDASLSSGAATVRSRPRRLA